MRKTTIVFLMILLTLSLQGCATLKGAAEGLKKDVKNGWEATKRTDSWIRENMW